MPPSSPPPTIAILAKECRGEVSLRKLAKDLGADVSNVRKAKKWLIENCHPAFEGYQRSAPLNPTQANTIILFRSYTTKGITGDALTERMFPDTATTNAKKAALRDLFEQHSIAPEQAALFTHRILEIFRS